MIKREPKLFFVDVYHSLEKISYKSVKNHFVQIDEAMKVVDGYFIRKVSFDEIVITVTRSIDFAPKTLFSLVVESALYLQLDQDEKKFVGKKDELVKYTEDNIETMINNSNLMETISLLISQITSSYGAVPIITPPYFVRVVVKELS